MFTETITPLAALFVSNLSEVMVMNEKNKKFMEAQSWAISLYPVLFNEMVRRTEPVDINWDRVDPSIDLDAVELTLLATANDITLQIAGPANALAAVMSYVKTNGNLLSRSPSAIEALNRFLSRLF